MSCPVAPRKRPLALPAQSPMTRMTQDFNDALDESCGSGCSPVDAQPTQHTQNSQGVFCSPQYLSADFCTPEDQTLDSVWSQKENEKPQVGRLSSVKEEPQVPPSPNDAAKRRKTQELPRNSFSFDYDLPPLPPEEAEGGPNPAASCLIPPPSPARGRPQAPSKPVKQRTLHESGFAIQAPAVPRAEAQPARTVCARKCNSNPFQKASLTASELRRPSRALLGGAGSRATRYIQEFEEVQKLGSGDFGSVHSARSRIDGCLYAVKRSKLIPRVKNNPESAFYEVFAMSSLANVSNVVRYHSSWVEDDELYIQMELCRGTVMSKYRNSPLPEGDALRLLEQMGKALMGMHSHGIAHMDVKPDNIFVTHGGEYRLGDFGLAASEVQVHGGVEPIEGDGKYAAPEAVSCLSQGVVSGLAPCDVYSLGVSVLELCLGRPLKSGESPLRDVREGAPVVLPGCSDGLCLLLTGMLDRDASVRSSTGHVVEQARLLGEAGTEVEMLRRQLKEEREAREVLERRIGHVCGSQSQNTPNHSMAVDRVNTSIGQDDEPMGSQESPYCVTSGQPVPQSPGMPSQPSFMRDLRVCGGGGGSQPQFVPESPQPAGAR